MRGGALTALWLCVLFGGAARGQDVQEAQEIQPPPSGASVDVTGYIDSRSSYARSRTWGLVPTDDQPQLQELLELNAQLRVSLRPRTFVSADVSLIGNAAGNYRGVDSEGEETVVADHQTAAAQPIVSINELYALHEIAPWLQVLFGKKRIVWGPGLAFNPTDFLNARRDPTDPTFQRAGAWLAQIEVPLELATFSLLFAPQVMRQASGIPTQFLLWPEWDKRDDEAHWQLAARLYALVANTDINVMFFYGNRFGDAFKEKLRVGASFSHIFFDDLEVHGEALVQSGSSRSYLNSSCLEDARAAAACALSGTPVLVESRLGDGNVLPRTLLGLKKQFGDDAFVALEYLWQADGWTPSQFGDYAHALGLFDEGRRAGLPVSKMPGVGALLSGPSADGLPARVAFDPRAQHYLFATLNWARIRDDFTLQAVVIANLQDFSTLWTPSIAWSATESLTLTLFGFVPAPGPDSLAAKTQDGVPVSEYGTIPFAYRVMLEARAYF